MKRLTLPLIAVLLVAAVLGVQVAAGGGHYVPRRPANPCTPRPVPPIPAQLGTARRTDRPARPRQRRVPARHLARTARPRARGHPYARPPRARRAQGGPRRRCRPARPRGPPAQGVPAASRGARPGQTPRDRQDDPRGDPGRARRQRCSRPRPLLRRTVNELDVDRLLHELNDPRQLEPAIRSAILQAALRQILDRLHP